MDIVEYANKYKPGTVLRGTGKGPGTLGAWCARGSSWSGGSESLWEAVVLEPGAEGGGGRQEAAATPAQRWTRCPSLRCTALGGRWDVGGELGE